MVLLMLSVGLELQSCDGNNQATEKIPTGPVNLNIDLNLPAYMQLANPGFIATRLTAQNRFQMPFIMTPEQAAGHMLRLMRSNRFKSSFPAPFSWLFRWGQGLPDWIWYRLFPRSAS